MARKKTARRIAGDCCNLKKFIPTADRLSGATRPAMGQRISPPTAIRAAIPIHEYFGRELRMGRNTLQVTSTSIAKIIAESTIN
jgi:hypothetical protein